MKFLRNDPTLYLKAQGVEVLRFWNHEVLLDMESVLSELALKVTPPRLLLN
jgi:very-short-patch-repair endonuclease